MKEILPGDYRSLLTEIKDRIKTSQLAALKSVNKELVSLYWDIGRTINERQLLGLYGDAVVKLLAKDLQIEFVGIAGFSWRNLFNMREFYLAYHDNEKLQPLVREISWTNNLVILTKSKDLLEREFYLRMTKKFGWTKNVLIHQIENQSYEKTLLGQTNFERALSPKLRAQAKLAVKDEYTSIFWKWSGNTANGNWSGRLSPASKIFSGRWAACSRLSAANFGWKSRARNFSSTCFSIIAGCNVWWLSI
jgi:predicted nuclease of restriction endonuclease-like (RecB) superfamily